MIIRKGTVFVVNSTGFVPVFNKYRLEEFLGKKDKYVENNKDGHLFIADITLLKENFDEFLHIISKGNFHTIDTLDYQVLEFLESNMSKTPGISCYLVDDGENKDRSYIDLDQFEKLKVLIPLIYTTWNVKSQKGIEVSCFRGTGSLFANPNNEKMSSANGNKFISVDSLKRIKEIILKLSEQTKGYDDIDKCILISNYIQEHIQYVSGPQTRIDDGIIIISDSKNKPLDIDTVSSVESVLFENYGLCMAIANSTSLLLNNPEFNVDIRSVLGSFHVWNVVTINGKNYYIDNTRLITRNPYRLENALKTMQYDDQYLFFGKETACSTGSHIDETYSFGKKIESSDLDRAILKEKQKQLSKTLNFEYKTKPIFPSYKK